MVATSEGAAAIALCWSMRTQCLGGGRDRAQLPAARRVRHAMRSGDAELLSPYSRSQSGFQADPVAAMSSRLRYSRETVRNRTMSMLRDCFAGGLPRRQLQSRKSASRLFRPAVGARNGIFSRRTKSPLAQSERAVPSCYWQPGRRHRPRCCMCRTRSRILPGLRCIRWRRDLQGPSALR